MPTFRFLFEFLRGAVFRIDRMSDGLQSVSFINPGQRNLNSGNADAAGFWDLPEKKHGASIAVMIVAGEAQMVVDGGGVFSRTIHTSGACDITILVEGLPVLQVQGQSLTADEGDRRQ